MQNGRLLSVSSMASPVMFYATSMARRSLKDFPTWSCGKVKGLATASCVGLGPLDVPPTGFPIRSTSPFIFDCGGATFWSLIGMDKVYGRKWPVTSVHVSGIRSGHLTGSALVNTLRNIVELSLNESHKSLRNHGLVVSLYPQPGIDLLCRVNQEHELVE